MHLSSDDRSCACAEPEEALFVVRKGTVYGAVYGPRLAPSSLKSRDTIVGSDRRPAPPYNRPRNDGPISVEMTAFLLQEASSYSTNPLGRVIDVEDQK